MDTLSNKTLFVNLSDIHIKESNKNEINHKLEKFILNLNAIKKVGNNSKIIILVSGDIAFSGRIDEYHLLDKAFEELATSYDLIMCPGNHDHDFSSYTSTILRNQILKIDPSLHDEETIKVATSGMNAYYKFESNFSAIQPILHTPLSKTYELDDDKGKIFISTLNTAWCSQIKECGGDITFPEKYLPDVKKNERNLIFFHHPLSWLEVNNQKEIRNRLREDYSIILTGHEHLGDSFKIIGETESCLMIEAIPFDDPSIQENGFITIEIHENDIDIKSYLWRNNDFLHQETLNKSDVMRKCSISTNSHHVNYDFYKSLLDIGVTYLHPDKDTIDLNDVFVYPTIKFLRDEDKLQMKKMSSEKILSLDSKKILLIGDEYCGKSTLLKKFFIDSIGKTFLPLLVEGASIRSGGVDYDKIILKQISKQYSNLTLTEFVTTTTYKVLLLDGFELIKGDRKSINVFLEKSYSIFDKIIITVSDTFDFGGSELLGESYFDDGFEKYEILKLGHRLRTYPKRSCQIKNSVV